MAKQVFLGSVYATMELQLDNLDRDINQAKSKLEKLSKHVNKTDFEGFNKKIKDSTSSLGDFKDSLARTAVFMRSLQVVFSGFTSASLVGAVAIAAAALIELGGAALLASNSLLVLPALGGILAGAFATVKIATLNMGDAFDAVADEDAEKLAEALKKLAPAAQRFVKAFANIRESFKPIQRAVQEKLFAGLDVEMTNLAKRSMPGLQRGLESIATEMNSLAVAAAKTAQEPMFQRVMAMTLQATADAMKMLAGTVGPLLRLIARLVEVGIPFADALLRWATDGIKAAEAFLATKDGADQLRRRIEDGVDALKQIADLIGEVGRAFINLFKASNSGSESLLQTLTRLVRGFNDWAETAEGGEKLGTMFRLLSRVMEESLRLIVKILEAFVNFANYIAGLPPGIQDLIAKFTAFLIVGTPVVLFLNSLRIAFAGLGGLAFSAGKDLAGLAKSLLGLNAATAAGGKNMGGFAVALRFIATPVGAVVAVIVAFIAVLVLLYTKNEAFRDLVNGVWKTISGVIGTAVNAITTFLQPMFDVIGRVMAQTMAFYNNLVTLASQSDVVKFALMALVALALTPLILAIAPVVVAFVGMVAILAAIATGVSAVQAKIDAIVPSLDLFGIRQQSVTDATNRAKSAQDALTTSQQAAKLAQDALSDAQLTANGAALSVERAQRTYNEAVKMYGPTSLEAREAHQNLQTSQANQRDVQADLTKKTQDAATKNKDLSEKTRDAGKASQEAAIETEKYKGKIQSLGDVAGASGGILKTAGNAIMQGFLDGLRSKYNEVKSFIAGIARWIEQNKGPISYDMKLLQPAGKAIMKGLEIGLTSQFDQVQGAIQKFTNGIGNTAFNSMPTTSDMSVTGSVMRNAALGSIGAGSNSNSSVTQIYGNILIDKNRDDFDIVDKINRGSLLARKNMATDV